MNAVDPQPMMNVRLNLEEGMDVKDKVTAGPSVGDIVLIDIVDMQFILSEL
jgi:hypothetical protein